MLDDRRWHRRWLAGLGAAALLAGCPAEERPRPADPVAAQQGGSPLEAQVRAGRGGLLAGVTTTGEKKAIMKQVSRELGVQCDYCHDVADFTAPTRNKTVAGYMFAHYAKVLEPRAGGVLTCGGCHAGQAKFLGDRADKERIKAQMKTQFVEAMQRRGGGPLECATCHGDKPDAPFLPR